jgi:hypothetical protein
LRILLADNRLGEYGGYDDAKLSEVLQGLPGLDGPAGATSTWRTCSTTWWAK